MKLMLNCFERLLANYPQLKQSRHRLLGPSDCMRGASNIGRM
jgi:hypothetical protein